MIEAENSDTDSTSNSAEPESIGDVRQVTESNLEKMPIRSVSQKGKQLERTVNDFEIGQSD